MILGATNQFEEFPFIRLKSENWKRLKGPIAFAKETLEKN